jgi:predicted AAA+ superfamily ATPase
MLRRTAGGRTICAPWSGWANASRHPGTVHRWWPIDEISAITGWAEAIKHLRDNDVEFSEDTVILTGSSAADLTNATSRLAGRGRSGDLVGDLSAVRRLSSAGGRADIGGAPGPIVQALFDIVQHDAFGAASLSQAQTVGLLARLSGDLTSPINASTIASELGISHDTVNRRLENLTTAYLTWPCYQSDRLRPRLGAQAKRYFTDPLLARLARLAHLRRSSHPTPDATRLAEQQLGMALIRHLENANPGSYAGYDDVLFERTPTRKEIDFVGHRLAPVAFEGKYTD